jgi:RNA polymerase-binding protein DksA
MLSPDRLERLRGLLQEQRQHILGDIGRAGPDELSTGASQGVGNHLAEDATGMFDREALLSLRLADQMTVQAIERSLLRIADGTYGICERCGQEIDFARLKARPYAAMCLQCQTVAEL